MSKSQRKTAAPPLDATLRVKQRKPVPHEFVLDALAQLSPRTHPMFGCLAIYVHDKVQEKIVLILRNKDKPGQTEDNGVWLATTEEHHQSLRRDFPNMRSIKVLGKNSDRLAGPSVRCGGFRRSGATRLRIRSRRRSSNRKGAGSPPSLEAEDQEGGKRSREAVTIRVGTGALASLP